MFSQQKEFFRNAKHTFQAIISDGLQRGSYSIKIGGKNYKDCINISIPALKSAGKIPHIESEPECTWDTFLEDGQMADFLRASLQFVNYKFPTVKTFTFSDMSRIECGKTKSKDPPRKLASPFSLAHLNIALYGKTWYEKQFSAKLEDVVAYNRYREAVKILGEPIKIPFEEFVEQWGINDKQSVILEKYFDSSVSWHTFFQSVPREDRCAAFFNWIPDFVDTMISKTFLTDNWIIDLNIMSKTLMEPFGTTIATGGMRRRTMKRRSGRRRQTRKKGMRFYTFEPSVSSGY